MGTAEKEWYKNFYNTVLRCMNSLYDIHSEIATYVDKATNSGYFLSEKFCKLLERCHKNEITILSIIDRNLSKAKKEIETHTNVIHANVKDQEIIQGMESILNVLAIYERDVEIINRRLLLQQKFCSLKTKESLKIFIAAWDDEVKVQEEIIKEFVKSSKYRPKLVAALKTLKQGVLAGAGAAGVLYIVNTFFFNPFHLENPTETTLALGLLATLMTLSYEMSSWQEKINQLTNNAIIKLRYYTK
ncbi:MAG: hypothetical protein WC916_07140 [Candidatus Woesearchaeota archaeon]